MRVPSKHQWNYELVLIQMLVTCCVVTKKFYYTTFYVCASRGLHFEANFECGNLAKVDSVIRQGLDSQIAEFDLYLNRDPGEGHAGWFYRFNICKIYYESSVFSKKLS
jgi:hypothetical protein